MTHPLDRRATPRPTLQFSEHTAQALERNRRGSAHREWLIHVTHALQDLVAADLYDLQIALAAQLGQGLLERNRADELVRAASPPGSPGTVPSPRPAALRAIRRSRLVQSLLAMLLPLYQLLSVGLSDGVDPQSARASRWFMRCFHGGAIATLGRPGMQTSSMTLDDQPSSDTPESLRRADDTEMCAQLCAQAGDTRERTLEPSLR